MKKNGAQINFDKLGGQVLINFMNIPNQIKRDTCNTDVIMHIIVKLLDLSDSLSIINLEKLELEFNRIFNEQNIKNQTLNNILERLSAEKTDLEQIRLVIKDEIMKYKVAEEKTRKLADFINLINHVIKQEVLDDLTVIATGIRLHEKTHDPKYLKQINSTIDKISQLLNKIDELEILISPIY